MVRNADRVCLSQIQKVPIGPYRTIKNKITQKKSDYSVIKQFPKILYERECFVGKHLHAKIKGLLNILLSSGSEETSDKTRII